MTQAPGNTSGHGHRCTFARSLSPVAYPSLLVLLVVASGFVLATQQLLVFASAKKQK